MNTRLNHIQDWKGLLTEAKWSASALAKTRGVSLRTLETYFHDNLGKSPRAWLVEQRMKRAIELIRDGSTVKETAIFLGYKHATHFARAFKKYWGHSPTAVNPILSQPKERRVS